MLTNEEIRKEANEIAYEEIHKLEDDVSKIVNKHWIENFECSKTKKHNLRLAVLDGYKAGLEHAKRLYKL